jgi:hypothetical protein
MSINSERAAAGITEPSPEQPQFTQGQLDKIVGERLARDRQARVIHEPRTYALDSPNSYYADVICVSTPDSGGREPALRRLGQYERELAGEMDRGTAEGRRTERIIRARLRTFDEGEHEQRAEKMIAELRTLTTGGGTTASASGGGAAAFVIPAFLLSEWAPFRGDVRAFADQCRQLPLPPFGMRVYIPDFTSTDSATQQTEGSAVSETDPETGLEGAQVQMVTGQITGTQQLHDRAFTGGGSMDAIIGAQLQQQLDERVDIYALGQAITNGNAVSGESSYSTAKLYQDLAKGREVLTDTAGVRLRPTHIFTTSDLYSYATRQVDSSERPVIIPQFVPGFPVATGDNDSASRPAWARFTGTVMPGGVLWFTDDNIPTVGTTSRTQIVVSAPADSIVLMEDEPVLTVLVETLANELKVVLNFRCYVAAVTRHAAGTSIITGGAYLSGAK